MESDEPIDTSQPASSVIETHISTIFLSSTRAFKLLKPVTMGFLDHSTSAARIAAAERELELNRRIAPDVYLGLAPVSEDGTVVDAMIVMRRLPESRRLSALCQAPGLNDRLREVARVVAEFHARSEPVIPAPMAEVDALAEKWQDNFAAIAPYVETAVEADNYTILGGHDFAYAQQLVDAYLESCGPLLKKRIAEGSIRDGHGDMTADDVFCLDDGPRILDCLAFRDDWRTTDVLADIAFLVMDIHRLAGPEQAQALMRYYMEFSNEHHPPSLAHHYVAYWAIVRAKVASLRFAQGDFESAALAMSYFTLAIDHLERARLRLILVGGGAGVGKTTLANGLAEQFSAVVLSTDDVRKAVTQTPSTEHASSAPGEGIYAPEFVDETYDELLREAKLVLSAGNSVVLDASWSLNTHRKLARALADDCGAELSEIEGVLDPAIAKERIVRRLANVWNPSDATPEVVDYQAARHDPWPEATPVSTADSSKAVCKRAAAQIEAQSPQPSSN